ncbi:hypothetical protein DPMN_082858 [Dreissena polymorpha]|uniref:Uncharacterized protein n=1 Tax=Dreissena polymorpha TaxID=45954 RepID=A0A9D3YBC5_DREPO|nr:hypothetical protein DPMN_082858 [Dreissena polymorpha]
MPVLPHLLDLYYIPCYTCIPFPAMAVLPPLLYLYYLQHYICTNLHVSGTGFQVAGCSSEGLDEDADLNVDDDDSEKYGKPQYLLDWK